MKKKQRTAYFKNHFALLDFSNISIANSHIKFTYLWQIFLKYIVEGQFGYPPQSYSRSLHPQRSCCVLGLCMFLKPLLHRFISTTQCFIVSRLSNFIEIASYCTHYFAICSLIAYCVPVFMFKHAEVQFQIPLTAVSIQMKGDNHCPPFEEYLSCFQFFRIRINTAVNILVPHPLENEVESHSTESEYLRLH